MEKKKLEGNYTRMLREILNKSWRQHPTKQQLCGHLPPITKTIKVRRTRHAGHGWRSKNELISDVLLCTPPHERAKAGRPAIYSSFVPIRDVVLKTCRKQWTIDKGGEKVSGISMLMVQHDDNDIYIRSTLQKRYTIFISKKTLIDTRNSVVESKFFFFYFLRIFASDEQEFTRLIRGMTIP